MSNDDQSLDDGTRLSQATHLSHGEFPDIASMFGAQGAEENARTAGGPSAPTPPTTERQWSRQPAGVQNGSTQPAAMQPASVPPATVDYPSAQPPVIATGMPTQATPRQEVQPQEQQEPQHMPSPSMGIMDEPGESIRAFQRAFDLLVDNIGKVVVGKPTPIKLVVTALMAGGHILLEDNPGTGKTQLARGLASSIRATFKRIQFTPDLLPSDVVGVTYYDQKSGEFEFRRGPVFASIVLADEINRASPKTQSALLEVMEEQKATVDGTTYPMEQPFIVIATQNPLEQLGTYKLPEAQMDRFLIKTSIGAPDRRTALEILRQVDVTDRAESVSPVLGGDDIVRLRSVASQVHMDDRILEYIERLVEATRDSESLKAGSSMRGALALTRCARIWAAADGRDYVLPDDVRDLAVPVLAHRLIPTAEAAFTGLDGKQIVEELLETVPTPNIDA